MYYIGIDPGRSGGAALLKDGTIIETMKFKGLSDFYTMDALRDWRHKTDKDSVFIMLEKVQAMRGKDGRKQGVSSAFKFGEHFGLLKGILTGLQMPFELVRPQVWQTSLSCRTGGDKNVTKNKALKIYPTTTITHAIADAILIGLYAMKIDRAKGQA